MLSYIQQYLFTYLLASPPALDDYSKMHDGVVRLQRHLQDAFPVCNELSSFDGSRGFTPHLSLGQFKYNKIEKFVVDLRSNWTRITFDVNSLFIISRKGFDDPFVIRKTINLTN
jgi:2'-5' RNA ligase superfamily